MMVKFHLNLLLLAVLSLIMYPTASRAAAGHEITSLSINTKPSNAVVGVAVKSLTMKFKLTAQTGIDVNRIKILFNDKSPGFVVSTNDFIIEPNANKPDTKASITYTTENVGFPSTSTNVTVLYCLTSVNCNEVLASASLVKLASASTGGGNTGGGGNNNGGDNGDTSNGGVTQTPRVFYMKLNEVTNGTEGVVSTEAKQFKLTIEHNTQYLDKVTEANFNANTNPILSNLKITSTNTFTGVKSKVTNDYDFTLNGASVDSSERPGFVITKYISNGKTLKSGQKLNFNIDLQAFFDKFVAGGANGAIIQDSKTITIKALTGTLSNMLIDPTALSFSNIGSTKGLTNYFSDTTNIKAKLVSNGDPSTVSGVDFFRLNKSKVKVKPKLSINAKKYLSIKPSIPNGSSASISSNGASFNISIPVNLETSAKEKTLIKQGFNDSSKSKTLSIPMIITTKTIDDLDLIFTDTLSDSVETLFEITTTNGSSL